MRHSPRRAGLRTALYALVLVAAAGLKCDHAKCACLATKAEGPLRRTYRQAIKLAVSAETGIVERGEFEDASNATAEAVESLRHLLEACADTCEHGCGGCRVARLMNSTQQLQRSVDEAAEFGYFVDDDRITTVLPRSLNAQAVMAKDMAESLLDLVCAAPEPTLLAPPRTERAVMAGPDDAAAASSIRSPRVPRACVLHARLPPC